MIPALTGHPVTDSPLFGELLGKGSIASGLWRMIRTDQWKYVWLDNKPDDPGFLYDLVNDPDESKNLVTTEKHPEVISDLRNRIDQWLKNTPPVLPAPSKKQKDTKNDNEE